MSRCWAWKEDWSGWKFTCTAVTLHEYRASVKFTRARIPRATPPLASGMLSSRRSTAAGDWFRSVLDMMYFPPAFHTQPSGAAMAALTRPSKSHCSGVAPFGVQWWMAWATRPVVISSCSLPRRGSLQLQSGEPAQRTTLSGSSDLSVILSQRICSFMVCLHKNVPGSGFRVFSSFSARSMWTCSTPRVLALAICACRSL
mmetsp:Transcript_16319/g.41689  ORF Transcript_16319/g.41689 Transcript_16319/m.41689 type:complete len:200 (+) Transcript_16319:373-972(+)